MEIEAHWVHQGAFNTLTPQGPSRGCCDSLLSGFGFLAIDAFVDNDRRNGLPGCSIPRRPKYTWANSTLYGICGNPSTGERVQYS